jgi:DNA-binding CsgD family transcriptional regulator
MSREKQILMLMSEGRSYKEIALELGVNYSTVAKACTRLTNKLGVRSRPELIPIAVERVPKTGRLVAV